MRCRSSRASVLLAAAHEVVERHVATGDLGERLDERDRVQLRAQVAHRELEVAGRARDATRVDLGLRLVAASCGTRARPAAARGTAPSSGARCGSRARCRRAASAARGCSRGAASTCCRGSAPASLSEKFSTSRLPSAHRAPRGRRRARRRRGRAARGARAARSPDRCGTGSSARCTRRSRSAARASSALCELRPTATSADDELVEPGRRRDDVADLATEHGEHVAGRCRRLRQRPPRRSTRQPSARLSRAGPRGRRASSAADLDRPGCRPRRGRARRSPRADRPRASRSTT